MPPCWCYTWTWMGYPPTWTWMGYPSTWTWMGYPPTWTWYPPHPTWTWIGYPPTWTWIGYPPCLDLDGVPPLPGPGMGYPPPARCGQTHKVKILPPLVLRTRSVMKDVSRIKCCYRHRHGQRRSVPHDVTAYQVLDHAFCGSSNEKT